VGGLPRRSPSYRAVARGEGGRSWQESHLHLRRSKRRALIVKLQEPLERVNGIAPSSQPWRGRILLLNYTRKISVIGLAPIRPDLKGRLLELLCIHGRVQWSVVSGQWLVVSHPTRLNTGPLKTEY
jgi:hypothetical protein